MLTNKGYVGIRQINTHSKDGREEGKKERKPFILYRRASGGLDGRIYYVAFWDPAARQYTNRRPTNKAAKGAPKTRRASGSPKDCRCGTRKPSFATWRTSEPNARSTSPGGRRGLSLCRPSTWSTRALQLGNT